LEILIMHRLILLRHGGSALARIVNVILHDQRAVMTVYLPTPEVVGVTNVTLSLPRLVGGKGILETFPLP
jgi:L-lactate dehydrogenase